MSFEENNNTGNSDNDQSNRRPAGGSDNAGYHRQSRDFSGGDNRGERPRLGAMEVAVEHSIEKALKILKRKLIKEGLFKELKARRYYEKPSEKKKRKSKESLKKLRKEESRNRRNQALFS